MVEKLTKEQLRAAYGRPFDVPGVLRGCSRVVFRGQYPSGNYGVRRMSDPPCFGDIAISPATAAPLLAAIAKQYDRRGRRQYPTGAALQHQEKNK